MAAEQKGAAEVKEELESSLESVDHAEELVVDAAKQMGFDEDERDQIGLALRECMVNAVVHGNRYNLRKKVYLEINCTSDRLEIVIGDEGEGFDTSQLPDPLAEENILRQSGRGVLMMQAFMNEFQVRRRDPQGTEVKMVKYLAKAGSDQ
ncbi:MAG: ATP-binding protein [Acidobacteriota bacterium]